MSGHPLCHSWLFRDGALLKLVENGAQLNLMEYITGRILRGLYKFRYYRRLYPMMLSDVSVYTLSIVSSVICALRSVLSLPTARLGTFEKASLTCLSQGLIKLLPIHASMYAACRGQR